MAMEMIQTLSQEAANLANKVKIYTNYQDYFSDAKAHVHSFNLEEITQVALLEISDIEYDLTLRKILWDAQEEWGTLFQEWRNSTLRDIDTELIQRNVSKWMNIIFILEKGKSTFLVFSRLGSHAECPLGRQRRCVSTCSQGMAVSDRRGRAGLRVGWFSQAKKRRKFCQNIF